MLSNVEQSIFYFFNHTIANPVCDSIIEFFMKIPGQYVLVLIFAIALFAGKRHLKITALTALSAYTIARYSYKLIKELVQRPRPFHVMDNVRLVIGPHGGYSFPSGHATTSFCLAAVIAMRYPKLSYPAFIIATLVALSRPYVGVHHPSDILVGSLLGMFIGFIVTRTVNEGIEKNA